MHKISRLLASLASRPAWGPGLPAPVVALLVGQLLSWTGNRLFQVALPLLVIERYGIGIQLGVVGVVQTVSRVLVGFIAGSLVDRLPRRAVIAVGNLGSALLVLAVPFSSSLTQLYVLSALLGVAGAFLTPANFGLLPEVFRKDQLLRINTLQEALDAITNLVGPGVAVWLISAFGPVGAFAADAVSYFLLLPTLLFLKPGRKPVEPGTASAAADARVGRSMRQVWAVLARDRMLAALLAANAAYTFCVGLLSVLYAPFALDALHAGRWGYGLLVTMTGFGALAGAALTPRFGPRLSPQLLFALVGLSGLLLVGVGSVGNLWLAAGLLGLALVPESAVFLVFSTRSQQVVPRSLTGRYFGAVFTALAVIPPLGNLLGGLFAAPRPADGVILAGAWLAFVGVVGLLARRPSNTISV